MIDAVSHFAPDGPKAVPAPSQLRALSPVGASLATGAQEGTPSATRAQPTTRLLVEPDGDHGFVYRLVDAATGRLLVELPREQVARLTADPGYGAGDLVSRSA